MTGVMSAPGRTDSRSATHRQHERHQPNHRSREVAGAEPADALPARPAPHHHRDPHQHHHGQQQKSRPARVLAREHPRQSREARHSGTPPAGVERAALDKPAAGPRPVPVSIPPASPARPTIGAATLTRFASAERRGQFQVHCQHRVRVGALRQRNQIRVAVHHRHDRRAVHRRRPQLRSRRQRDAEIADCRGSSRNNARPSAPGLPWKCAS